MKPSRAEPATQHIEPAFVFKPQDPFLESVRFLSQLIASQFELGYSLLVIFDYLFKLGDLLPLLLPARYRRLQLAAQLI